MAGGTARITVWDWALRLVHWLMVLIVPLLWWTAEEGIMDWHRRLGLTLLSLVLFRLLWGLWGPWTARFWPMLRQIGSAPSYARTMFERKDHATFGHNPMGVLSVFALLLALSVQLGTGLFAVDVDGLESGPLSILVSFDMGRQFAEIHEINFNILLGFIVLHLVAIAVYQFFLKDNLIGPMVTGRRAREDFADGTLPEIRVRPIALILGILLSAAIVYGVMNAG